MPTQFLTQLDEHIVKTEQARERRGHLGFSQIGNKDERTIWLKHRWCLNDIEDARVLRIFRLGDAIEEELARFIRQVPGIKFFATDPENGKQFRFKFLGGHFAGSMDGCILGIPEAPKTWHVWEAKSAKDSKFKELLKAKGGVKDWSDDYWGQAHC